MIHLVCGPIGAGKTTVACELSESLGAIRFSEDEWLAQLFVADAPADLLQQPVENIAAWAADKYQRCRGQIWSVAQQLITQGIPIVLDGAAANKEQRDLIRAKAASNQVAFQLHYVTSDRENRRKRVLERNRTKGKTYALDVTAEMFEMMEQFFQPPSADELIGARIIET